MLQAPTTTRRSPTGTRSSTGRDDGSIPETGNEAAEAVSNDGTSDAIDGGTGADGALDSGSGADGTFDSGGASESGPDAGANNDASAESGSIADAPSEASQGDSSPDVSQGDASSEVSQSDASLDGGTTGSSDSAADVSADGGSFCRRRGVGSGSRRSAQAEADATQPDADDASTVTVQLCPMSTTLLAGETMAFATDVEGSANRGIDWAILGAAGPRGTITAGGFYTAPLSPGVFQVRATSQADPRRATLPR